MSNTAPQPEIEALAIGQTAAVLSTPCLVKGKAMAEGEANVRLLRPRPGVR
ncbi:MAG: hypothetical protein WA840_09955 [Caulobacteraceae bacterium]